ncbi:hypothetical protein [Thalassospira sp. MCCC 1A01428]|uniref:hypothetical protein n=1 Tax=Thalassospira sp. MCCC 1A01428 TaxID=1470575 RepID=UPI000A1FDDCA|nr:hypothetical protein [Thalassospira sp. MCCC 1A01428]OSQ38665.1 hypothetical protein THS27_21955 [Thalassospira sp. MCCC 1A01428]
MIGAGLSSRIKTVGEGWDQGQVPTVVIKHTSRPPKTSTAIRALVDYISCAHQSAARPALKLNLFDEFGEEVEFADRRNQLKNWPILSDKENLRPRQSNPVSDNMRRYQAHHLIWSFDVSKSHLTEERVVAAMQAVTRQFVFDQFAMDGRAVLWTIHRDKPGRPHVHMVVSGFNDDGRALGLDKSRSKLDDFSAELARYGRLFDLPMKFERREDNPLIRRQVINGAVLRNTRKRVSYERSTNLWDRVPNWWGRYSSDLLDRLENLANGVHKSSRRPKVSFPPASLPHIFSSIFTDPKSAATCFAAMVHSGVARSEKSLALWYLINRPEYFGYPLISSTRDSRKKIAARISRVPVPTFPETKLIDRRGEYLRRKNRQHQLRDLTQMVRSLNRLRKKAEDARINEYTVLTIKGVAEDILRAYNQINVPPRKRENWRIRLNKRGKSLFTRKK